MILENILLVCNVPLGMRDGGIDKDQITYTSVTDGSGNCRTKDAGRMASSDWCTGTPNGGKEYILIRFHHQVIVTGVLFDFKTNPQSYIFKYVPFESTEIGLYQDLSVAKDVDQHSVCNMGRYFFYSYTVI